MMKKITPILLIIILGFAAYINSSDGDFIWDDAYLLKHNAYIKSWSNIPRIFTTTLGAGSVREYSNHYYRPLQMLLYTLHYSLWKLDVRAYHITNTLLHVFVALAIYWLINILYKNKLLSFLAAVFFVVHPIHTETISWMTNASDPLAAVFVLLSLIFYIKYHGAEKIAFWILSAFCFILAILSKESALILPFALLLYNYCFKKKLKIKIFITNLVIILAYVIFRAIVIKPFPLSFGGALERVPGFFIAVVNYIRLLVWPFNLHAEYGEKLYRFGDAKAILGAITIICLSAYALRKRSKSNLVTFSILWFFVMLLPLSNLYPLSFYMAEHYIYLPSIGFFLLLSYGITLLYRIGKFRMLVVSFVVLLLSFYSYLTIKQNNYWQEPVSFYERTLKYAPDSARVHYNLGKIYDERGDKEKAKELYEKAVELHPDFARAYNNLGNIYFDRGNSRKALELYKKAAEEDPYYAPAYYNLANIYRVTEREEEAIKLYIKAIDIDPFYIEAYNNLGITYRELGREEEAKDAFQKVLFLLPTRP